MIKRHFEELDDSIQKSVQTINEESDNILEVEVEVDDNSIVIMKQQSYMDLIIQIAILDNTLRDNVLLAIGGQITGWEDTTANLLEVAEYHLHVSLELVQQVVLQDEETYDNTDGVDKVTVSPLGWERYLELRKKYE